MTVAQRLHGLRYSLQGNAKTKEGKQHPGRDAQFRYIQRQGKAFLSRGWPVISVDTKKKELVGTITPARKKRIVGQAFQPCQAGKPDLLPCRGNTNIPGTNGSRKANLSRSMYMITPTWTSPRR